MQALRIFLLVLALIPTLTLAAPADDYLPPELRSRVEQLKLDLAATATNRTNARARAATTWEWINAFALDGRYVPVNTTQIIASVLGPDGVGPLMMSALDSAIRELQFFDEQPSGAGSLNSDTGPFVAGRYATIRQTLTVGTQTIQTGGGLMVARHFMPNFGLWQASDPSAPNYISIQSSNAKVSFLATSVPMRGMHGGFRGTRPTLVFKVASGTLREGDTVTITYGDTTKGSPGLMMPSFSSDRMPLPLYLAFADDDFFVSLPIQPIRIEGQTIAGVHGFLPSVLKPGERFTLSIRAQDKFFNRAAGEIPNWRIRLNDEHWLDVPATGAITTVNTAIANPGIYHPTITSVDGDIVGTANPVLVTETDRDRIYWGDTHGHSGFAEGIGTPERFMQWAKEDARLDYVTHSEHDIWLDDAEWEVLRNNVRQFTEDGRFVAYLGYEWTVANVRGGHHNVLFRRPDNQNRVPAQFYPTLTKLYQGLRANAAPQDVVVIPHAHQAGDYRLNDPELEPLVEIMSQHGNFEWFGRMYLQHGHQVGFTAASDNHLSQPGYSAPLGGSLSQRGGLGAILAKERTVDGIFDGMKQLRSYATTGDRIILDFSVNDTPMGHRGDYAGPRTIKGRVIGTSPIDTITVIKNEHEIWQQNYLDDDNTKLDKTATYLLSFASDSHPHHRGDNPRGWRAWRGTLEVHNADIEEIAPWDSSFSLQTVTPSADNPNQVTFDTQTRGDASSFFLRLKNTQRTARIQIDLVESRETGGAPPIYRGPARIPASSFELNLRDMEEGRIEHNDTVDHYTDSVVLRKIVTSGPRTVEFEVQDTGTQQGDYYFVRVTQANDAIAWSSPVWIGGFDKR